jgi:uncharacterized protein (UPF0276 family)
MVPEVTVSLPSLADFTQTRSAFAAAGFPARLPLIEILWDNYCAQDPVKLADHLAVLGERVLVHVMWSRFFERDEAAFVDYIGRLAHHVRVLRPVAVSDHLCRFQIDGTFLGAGQEYTYDRLDHVRERVARYQDAIGQQLLIENNASCEQPLAKQVAFVGELVHATGCGILYDVSNAVAGELNGCGPAALWHPLIAGRELRCHVGSYHHDEESDKQIDSHQTDVSRATSDALRALVRAPDVQVASITYERDFNRSAESIAADLVRIRECL